MRHSEAVGRGISATANNAVQPRVRFLTRRNTAHLEQLHPPQARCDTPTVIASRVAAKQSLVEAMREAHSGNVR
jgi:hypothetical protein